MGVSDGGHAETCSHCHGDVILMGVMFVLWYKVTSNTPQYTPLQPPHTKY